MKMTKFLGYVENHPGLQLGFSNSQFYSNADQSFRGNPHSPLMEQQQNISFPNHGLLNNSSAAQVHHLNYDVMNGGGADKRNSAENLMNLNTDNDKIINKSTVVLTPDRLMQSPSEQLEKTGVTAADMNSQSLALIH
jgi:hypothetical protein